MRATHAALLLASVLAAASEAAPAPLPRRVKPADGRRHLDGAWVVQSVKLRGGEVGGVIFAGGLAFQANVRAVISEGMLHFPDRGGRRPARWAIQAPRGTRQIDLLQSPDGPARMLGICALEGETLTLAFTTSASQRPEDFSGDQVVVIRLKRGGP
jgi:uncharacterized protein (TIGR03067 family)